MSVRLKVGTYVLDAAETGSTSTTTGVRLLPDEGPGVRWSVDGQTAELPVAVQVSRDTTANLKTSLDALIAAMTATVNADLVLEYASGSTLASFLVSTGAWSRITCKAMVEGGETSALVLLVFTAERIAVATGSAGDAAGSLGPMDFSYGFDSNGRGSGQLSATFKTLADAKAWVQTVRAGTGRPSFLGSAWKFITVGYSGQQQENQGSPVPPAAYTPCSATCLLRALPSDLASALPSEVIDVEYDGRYTPGAPINADAGHGPGYNVVITGSLQVKGDKDSTFDSADTSAVAGSSLPAIIRNTINAVRAHFEARIGATIEVRDEPEWAPSGTRGEIAFVLTGLAGGGDILSLIEEVQISRLTQNRRLGGTRGVRVYPHANGAMIRVTQTLTIAAKTLPAYRPLPFINDDTWDEDEFTPVKPDVQVSESGARTFVCTWRGAWTRVGENPGIAGMADYEEIAGVI